jgi:hypothetical protein
MKTTHDGESLDKPIVDSQNKRKKNNNEKDIKTTKEKTAMRRAGRNI